MRDPRIDQLANSLVNYSVEAKPGDKVLIDSRGDASALTRALVRAVYAAGAVPFVWLADQNINRELLLKATAAQLDLRAKYDGMLMDEMDCYIGITAPENASALSDVGQEQMQLYQMHYVHPVHLGSRLEKTRWVVLRYPTPAFAQAANMSDDAFDDFYFNVCCFDYRKLATNIAPLKALMERTDKVRIHSDPTSLSPRGTELSFSIKGMPAIPCCGDKNIPDGEIYTAPVKNSVNGVISYNTAASYQGFVFEKLSFEFKDGKIVHAEGNDSERVNKILDTDAGARYVGEFALGVNPFILNPLKETLFDEKIAGSIHFTPGNAYDDCDNGNKSAVHWDLVLIQRPEWGGGEIWFDDVLVRKDGEFVLPELQALNYHE
jgi:aminopeptidase